MFKKSIIYLFLVLFSFPFLGFAWYCDWDISWAGEKPPICYSSPEIVDKYLQDMVYVISLVSNAKSNSSGLWALWKKVWDTWIWSLAVATMFASNWLWNFFQNFIIIFKWPDIVRDRVKITNFQQYITKNALELSSKWILNQNISNLTAIKNYIKLKDSFIIEPDWITTYKDLFKYLWQNQILFEQIYYEKVVLKDSVNAINHNVISTLLSNWYKFPINSNALFYVGNKFDIYNKYNCNTFFDDFKKNLKHIICSVWWKELSKANDRFKCNYNRLLYVLELWPKPKNQCWSVAIAKWIPLSKRVKSKVSVEWIWTLSYNNEWIQNWWTEDTQALNQMSKDLKKYSWLINWIKELWSELNPSNWKAYKTFTWNVSPADYAIAKQTDFINYNLNAVISDYNEVKNITNWLEPWNATHWITTLFPQISQQIDEIRQKIWKSVSEKDTIYKNLEKTCQNQSPQKWNCSYSK